MSTVSDSELKARHRAMWASGDYPSMVETFLLPLGPRLVEACGIADGMKVLDVAGTVRSLLPFLERMGMVRAVDVDVDTLEDRLRDEVAGQDGIQLLPAVMGAWART